MEKESIREQPSWFDAATEKWKEMEWGERQYWLAQVAEEQDIPRTKFVMTHKHFDFDKIPDEYQKILAKKWGFIEENN